MFPEQLILIGSLLLLISIIISKTSHRLGIPSLIFFLLIGMLAGSEGIGGIYFNDPNITQFIGIIALVFILFSGGLDTKWGGGEIHTLEGNSPFYCRSSDHRRWCGTFHQLDHRFFLHRIPANRLHRFFHRCRGSIRYLPVTWGKEAEK